MKMALRKTLFKITLLALPYCLCMTLSSAAPVSPQKLRVLYNSLEPYSVAQHLALYELYPETEEGKYALAHAWKLLMGNNAQAHLSIPLLGSPIDALISLINKQPDDTPPDLAETDLSTIETIASSLHNRKLKGHYAKSEEDLLNLNTTEIDLARGLFLSQFGTSDAAWQKLRTYEAHIDLMALQIRARLSANASPKEIIAVINHFIFFEMGFRFPPHSLYAKEIDTYTFLPSVLDSRRGVCLGVSILYLSIAQRLNLPLEIITPPGHIYLRYRSNDQLINIETTARGVHVDNDEYLGIDTLKLQQRHIKEVIGMAHFNQAAAYLEQKQPDKALTSYEKAFKYLPMDMLTMEFMGICCILAGQEERGRRLLENTVNHIPDYAVCGNPTAADYLYGNTDKAGLEALFMHVDENRESILCKQRALQEATTRFSKFRAGYFALAATWLQLHRNGEALDALAKYHDLDPTNPTAEYYLAVLYAERYHFPKAWAHLRQAERLTAAKDHYPKALKELRQELFRQSP